MLEGKSGHGSRGSVGEGAKWPLDARRPTIEPGNGVLPAARCANGDLGALDQPSTHTPSTRQRAARRRRRRCQRSPRSPQTRARPPATRDTDVENRPKCADFIGFRPFSLDSTATYRRTSRSGLQTAGSGCPHTSAHDLCRFAPRRARTRGESANFVAGGLPGAHHREFRRWGAGTAVSRLRARFLRTLQCPITTPRHQDGVAARLKFG